MLNYKPRQKVIHNPIPTSFITLSLHHSAVCFDITLTIANRTCKGVGIGSALARKARGVGSNPTGRAEFFILSFLSTFLPLLLTLHTPPFFQSTRREIGSETTDNLSEDNPVKNAYRASAHALILSYPYIFVSSS